MSNERSRNWTPTAQGAAVLGSNMQADYSYTQWRHTQIQQLERNYRTVCERARQFARGES